MSGWRARLPRLALPSTGLPRPGHAPPPHPWGSLFVGLGLISAAAVTTAMLIGLWATARPTNLVPISDALVRMATEAVQEQQVPSTAIRIAAPALRQNPIAVWHEYAIEVDLSPLQHATAIVRGVRARLEPRHVAVRESATQAGEHELRLAYGGVEFASILLRGGRMTPERKRDFRAASERVARQVERIVHERLPVDGQIAVMPAQAQEDATTEWSRARFEAYVPDGLAMQGIQRALEGAMIGREVEIEIEEREGGTERVIRVAYQRYPVVEVLLTPRPPRRLPEIQMPTMDLPPGDALPIFDPGTVLEPDAPEGVPLQRVSRPAPAGSLEWTGPVRIALIIDDGGEEPEATEVILGLDRSLTLAILPDTSGGTALAERAVSMGFEVMLHMPMETENARQTYPNTLTTGMDAEELARLVERARAQVPGAVGINNHTGGVFTADPAAVARLMGYLATTPLYFVDSRTTPHTVAFDVARAHGIRAAKRDVFLDNEPDFDSIEDRFNELAALAKAHGAALGIAHFRPHTAEALVLLLPRLEEEGIRLVPVSELVQ